MRKFTEYRYILKKCSKSCGEDGIRERNIYCIYNNVKAVNDSYCDSKAPSIYEPCNRHECPQWRVGEWGACTKSCFNSTRSRLVYCMNMSSHVESNQCRQR